MTFKATQLTLAIIGTRLLEKKTQVLASVLIHLVEQPRPSRECPRVPLPRSGVPKSGTRSAVPLCRNLPSPSLPPPSAWAEGQLAQRGEALSHRHTHALTPPPPPRRWLVLAAGGVVAFPAPTKRLPSPPAPGPQGHEEPKFRLIGWALIRGPLRPPLTPNDIDPLHLLPRRSAPGAPAVALCATGENK